MKDFIFIFFTLAIVFGLIYLVYLIMLGSSGKTKDEDLQITSEDLLQQLKILHRQKKYHIAECMAKKFLEKRPSNDDIRMILTKSLYDNGKIYEAIEHAKVVIRHQPNNADMKILLAKFYEATLKQNQAISILKDILKDDPQNVSAIREIAQVYMNTNQKSAAIEMYVQLSDLVDNNHDKVKIKTRVAQMMIESKDFGTAIEQYREILEIYPADLDTKKKLIDVYMLTSDWTLAAELARELWEMHTNEQNDLYLLKILTEACIGSKEFEQAMEYANLVKTHPLANDIDAAEGIAKVLLASNEIEKSTEILAQLVLENPHNTELKRTLAAAYEAKKDFHSAANTYKKILDEANAEEILLIHHEMSNIYSNWALYLFEEKEVSECFKKFTTALQYDSENPQIYYRLGFINQSIKNYNEAISQYKKAIERNVENPSYYFALAECYEAIDNVFEEKKALSECQKYEPENPHIYYKLSRIYHNQHDLTNAINEIKKAIELDSNFVDAKYELAILLELKGNKDEAIELYEQILEINPEYKEVASNLKLLKS